MNSTLLQFTEDTHFCYKNVTNSCKKIVRSNSSYVAIYFAFCLGMLVTVLGNLLVIVSVAHFKVLHSPTNFLVLSLAITDFLIGFVIMPFSIVRSVETCWYFGDDFCRLHTCLDSSLCLVSIFHLCFIAVDRYNAVCKPLLYTSRNKVSVVLIYIGTGWTVSLSYTIPWLYSNLLEETIKTVKTESYCLGSCQLVYIKIWGWINLPLFLIPCFLMIALYLKIYCVAQRQVRIIDNARHAHISVPLKKASKREKKATKTLGITIGVYFLCWFPFLINTMIDPLINFSIPPLLSEILFWIAYFNSACNPFIYGFFFPWFRKSLKIIITFRIFCSESSSINLYQ
ncbi:trace amine-associated receptor 5-like [Protopterus annectens]|uniref:trace amine-associated receptor 5-like n=1 Tax=Protopterus annectens TaxID=7888 RepID=UPI001CFC26AF|nr:trace amine-associated receptor 5-like [Protopterus annectens]